MGTVTMRARDAQWGPLFRGLRRWSDGGARTRTAPSDSMIELDAGGMRYTLAARRRHGDGLPVLSTAEAMREIGPMLHSLEGPRDRQRLAGLLASLEHRVPDDPRRLEGLLAWLVESEQVTIAMTSRRIAAAAHEGPPVNLMDLVEPAVVVEPEPEPEPQPQPQPQPEPTYVAFRLLDADGDPIAERPFLLSLADGRTLEGTTDQAGAFEVDPVLMEGVCTVQFLAAEAA